MRSSVETVEAYEALRLRGQGYGVTVTPIYALPMDGQLGNDVIIGILTLAVNGDSNPADYMLSTEGLSIGGLALQGGAVVALRRRVWFSGPWDSIKLTDAVRLHPCAGRPTDKCQAKQ